jgi:hypothetical protein
MNVSGPQSQKIRGDAILVALMRQINGEIESLRAISGVEDSTDIGGASDRKISIADIYSREIMIVPHLGARELKIRIAAFRDMLKSLSTDDSYSQISRNFIVDLQSEESVDAMREELRALYSRLYRRYSMVTAVEVVRSRIAYGVIAVALLLSMPLVLHIFRGWLSTAFTLAAMCGASGAAVSTIVRLYQVDTRHEPLITWLNLEKSEVSLWVAPALGAVFGMVLVLILYAGVLHVDFLPNFEGCWWKQADFHESFCEIQKNSKFPGEDPPIDNRAYADLLKLALWSFLAGWAERLVPDALNRIYARGQAAIDKA